MEFENDPGIGLMAAWDYSSPVLRHCTEDQKANLQQVVLANINSMVYAERTKAWLLFAACRSRRARHLPRVRCSRVRLACSGKGTLFSRRLGCQAPTPQAAVNSPYKRRGSSTLHPAAGGRTICSCVCTNSFFMTLRRLLSYLGSEVKLVIAIQNVRKGPAAFAICP